MGKSSPPPPPNYGPLLESSKVTAASDAEAARIQGEIAREQLASQNAWAAESAKQAQLYGNLAQRQSDIGVEQYQDMLPYLQKYMNSQLDFTGAALDNQKQQTENAALSNKQAQETYNRYMTTYAPREDQFTQEAFDYASPARMEQDAAAARGDVATAFQSTQDAAKRQLASYGVDPSQGAYGRTQAIDISKAAAMAAAGTMARKQTEAQGKQYEVAALQMGQKLPAQAIAQAGLGNQQTTSGLAGSTVGGAGIQAGSGFMNSATNMMGSPTAYAGLSNPYTQLSGSYGSSGTSLFGAQNQALGNAGSVIGTAGNLMNNMYSNQMEGYKAQAAQSPWGAIGKIAGMAVPFIPGFGASDRRLKEDTRVVGQVGALPVHLFRYREDPEWRLGYMADEVEQVDRDAVITTGSGIKMVNYERATNAALRSNYHG